VRADLLALTPEKVTALSNAGLVKRALRELEAGQGPRLEEDAKGVVRGTFPDGVVATLPPGVLLREAPCTCGSVAVCRHRVSVALAYARSQGGSATAEPWSPAEITDAQLQAVLGKRMLEQAQRLVSKPLVVTVTRAAIPVAALPTCSVRFLVARDPAYAKCDCARGEGCEHIALSVFAFREAEKRGPLDAPRTIELGAPTSAAGAVERELDLALEVARQVLRDGVTHAPAALAQRFARATAALEAASYRWPLEILGELQEALEAYRERSARYRPSLVASLVAELAARARAASTKGELPRSAILGIGEPRETLLDQVRLISLGARLDAAGSTRLASVYLADPDSATVLVLEKTWTFREDETPPEGPDLGRRSVVPNIRLDALAHGQLVSRAVKRRANRMITLGSGTASRTSVVGQSGEWGTLPESLLVSDSAALERMLGARPPRLLAPRVLAENVRVLAVTEVSDLRYAPGDQTLSAILHVARGQPIRLERSHRSCAPHALDALSAILEPDSPPRFVSGEVRRTSSGLVIDPLAIVGARVVVPDLAEKIASANVELGHAPESGGPIDSALAVASGLLDALVHGGLAHDPPLTRVHEAGSRLDAVGLGVAAARMRRLAEALKKASDAGMDSALPDAANAWFDAAIRVALTIETMAAPAEPA
jgi:hypothetical protein